MDQPLITIVTITYNAERELAPTMKSVSEQDFSDYEHLIIDGASNDGTLEVAKRLGTHRMRVVSEPDSGLYNAMNKGLRQARGRYVLFLNAGDSFHDSHTLSDYASAARQRADIVYGDTVIVDSARQVIAPRHLSAPEKLTFRSFAKGMLVCHQAFMVRRGLAPEYDERYRFSADYDWTVKCLKASDPARCINLNKVTIDYLADGTTDRNKLKSLRERYRIMSRHYGAMPTAMRHIGFVGRAAARKIKNKL